MPGQLPSGRPSQDAAATRPASYRPKYPPTTDPAATPITGAQRRSDDFAFKAMPRVTSTVARAVTAAEEDGMPSGTRFSMLNAMGITVTEISMMTVPETAGVRILRNRERRADSRNWNSDEMMMSVAISAGPPCASAPMQTAIKLPDVPIMST